MTDYDKHWCMILKRRKKHIMLWTKTNSLEPHLDDIVDACVLEEKDEKCLEEP